ncbi:MAG: NADH-quinone oxidoreductase subunit C [Ardenticatenales bacterium]|nr:NADH-quinone oxidoreductase subunit C [Ardenticatenales bacterium]
MSETETRLMEAEALLANWVTEKTAPAPHRLDLSLPPDALVAAVQKLHEAGWGYLAAITGLDLGVEAGVIEVLYHFCHGAAVLGLRVGLERDRPVIPTICSIIPSASFFERELSEMFGITVEGTPNPARLFLPDEWPAGVHPLRKDYEPAGQE